MAVSIKTEALRTLTGQVETALLVIHDFRQMARNANTGQAGGLTAAQTLQAISNELAAGTQAALGSGTTPTYPNSQDKIFKVQFNPSELTLNATSYPVNKVNTANGQSRTMTVEDPSLFLWVNLYFDDMQTTDAFMGEKFNTLVSAQGVANVANSVMSAMGKNKHTVPAGERYDGPALYRAAEQCTGGVHHVFHLWEAHTGKGHASDPPRAGSPHAQPVVQRLRLRLWDGDQQHELGDPEDGQHFEYQPVMRRLEGKEGILWQ